MEAELNKKFWTGKKLNSDIKEKLVTIAQRLVTDLEIEVKIKHIIFTGSLASFSYRASSDLDLHIIVDPVGNYDDVAPEYLNLFCKLFNDYHSIFIRGYKLEVNIKLEETVLDDKGIYDILEDTWIQFPSLPSKELSDKDIKDIVLDYQEKIDELINSNAQLNEIDALRIEIKNMRTSGLAEDGEYSTGNLAFKELRNSGYIEKLYDFKIKREDDFLSFESFSGFFNRVV